MMGNVVLVALSNFPRFNQKLLQTTWWNLRSTHRLVLQLLGQQQVCFISLLHLPALLVIVDGQLLQSLQHLLHLLLGQIVLRLQPTQLLLDLLVVAPRRRQQLKRPTQKGVIMLDISNIYRMARTCTHRLFWMIFFFKTESLVFKPLPGPSSAPWVSQQADCVGWSHRPVEI